MAMISSVIATLIGDPGPVAQALDKIGSHPAFEVGELIEGRRVPITIETNSSDAMEQATDWLLSQDGVEFVDVVFVHFGEVEEASQIVSD